MLTDTWTPALGPCWPNRAETGLCRHRLVTCATNMPPSKRQKKEPEPYTLQYFGVMAKGLGPTLIAEHAGLPWTGNKDA